MPWIAEPLFPYYLFIRLDRIASNWRPIRSTRGVLKLLTFGDEPVAVADNLIDILRQNASVSPEEGTANVYFRGGDNVEIIEGPFQDLKAVFESQKGEERAIVLLNMLHKQQRWKSPFPQLRRPQ